MSGGGPIYRSCVAASHHARYRRIPRTWCRKGHQRGLPLYFPWVCQVMHKYAPWWPISALADSRSRPTITSSSAAVRCTRRAHVPYLNAFAWRERGRWLAGRRYTHHGGELPHRPRRGERLLPTPHKDATTSSRCGCSGSSSAPDRRCCGRRGKRNPRDPPCSCAARRPCWPPPAPNVAHHLPRGRTAPATMRRRRRSATRNRPRWCWRSAGSRRAGRGPGHPAPPRPPPCAAPARSARPGCSAARAGRRPW